MAYWMEDANGKYLGDIASAHGIIVMRESAGPSLLRFLEQGEADSDLIAEVRRETTTGPASHVARALLGAKAPVIITDGQL